MYYQLKEQQQQKRTLNVSLSSNTFPPLPGASLFRKVQPPDLTLGPPGWWRNISGPVAAGASTNTLCTCPCECGCAALPRGTPARVGPLGTEAQLVHLGNPLSTHPLP